MTLLAAGASGATGLSASAAYTLADKEDAAKINAEMMTRGSICFSSQVMNTMLSLCR